LGCALIDELFWLVYAFLLKPKAGTINNRNLILFTRAVLWLTA